MPACTTHGLALSSRHHASRSSEADGDLPERRAHLPAHNEVRKTAVMPSSHDQRSVAAWQVYLDNFASWAVVPRHLWTKAETELSSWHRAARECWLRWNIPSAQDKSLSQDCHAKDLGCYSNGDRGTLGSTVDRRLTTAGISLYVIGADRPHRMWLASATGCWNFVFQFRRPTSCVLFQTWRAISHWVNCRTLPREVGRELLMAISRCQS